MQNFSKIKQYLKRERFIQRKTENFIEQKVICELYWLKYTWDEPIFDSTICF